jgi:hypothetical protein
MDQYLTRFGSGTNWTERELAAYNISIIQKDERSFFGGPLPTYDVPLVSSNTSTLLQDSTSPLH